MKNLILSCIALVGLVGLVGCDDSCDKHTDTSMSMTTDSKDMAPRHHHVDAQ